MEVLYPRCCGIDIHKKSVTVCVLIREPGRKEQKHIREFGTTTSEILSCGDWLRDLEVTHVAVEKQNAPFEEAVSLLAEIPGFDGTTAWSVIAEIEVNMSQFPSADDLASWAGVCPGNNESAGKRLSGKTRKGSRWLRQKLCQSAWCASRCENSYFVFFQRIAAHRGRKRAIVAVSHALLVVCYYLLQRKCHFQDLGVNYFDQLNHEKLTKYFVKRLTRLGHRVTIEPCSAAA
jgi:transposase